MASVLTIDDGNDYAIFVTVDVVTISKDVLLAVRKRVAELNPQIDTEKIIMNCTHTHAGPLVLNSDDLGGWGRLEDLPHDGIEITSPVKYFAYFVEKVSEAICESFESRAEGYISYGYGYAVASHNRRAVYFKDKAKEAGLSEGYAKMYGNTALPEFSHLETGGNPYAEFMFTYDSDEKLTGVLLTLLVLHKIWNLNII